MGLGGKIIKSILKKIINKKWKSKKRRIVHVAHKQNRSFIKTPTPLHEESMNSPPRLLLETPRCTVSFRTLPNLQNPPIPSFLPHPKTLAVGDAHTSQTLPDWQLRRGRSDQPAPTQGAGAVRSAAARRRWGFWKFREAVAWERAASAGDFDCVVAGDC